MNRLLPFFFLLATPFFGFSQNSPSQEKILKYAETLSPQQMEAHVRFLSDDLLEGRETGQRGQQLAARYLEAQFRLMGIPPGADGQSDYLMRFHLVNTHIRDVSFRLGNQEFNYRSDFFTFDPLTLPEKLEGEFVYCGYGLRLPQYDNLAGLELGGKIALTFAGNPFSETSGILSSPANRTERMREIEKAGAKAALMVLPDSTFYSMNYYARKRSMEVTEDAPAGMPLIYISEKMAESLLDRSGLPDYQKLISELAESPDLTRYKAKQPEWSYRADLMKDATDASNVLGFLEGTDKKDEIIVLTAHYDHLGINKQGEVYNGADDDGSGVATILELAEAFSIAAKEGNRPRRSILFMLVSGEEKGLLGSEFYTEHPVFPLSQTVANLNIDMIGRVDKRNQEAADSLNYVYIIGSDKLSSDLHQINESANETFTKLRFDYTYNEEEDPNRFYYRSDHFNFAKNGVPVIFYFTGTHGDYHQPGDDVEKLHFDKIAKIGRLILATTWELANREDRIRLDKKAN